MVEIASAPAAVKAVIVAVSKASSVIVPVVAVTLVSALAIEASMALSIAFVASATAIEIAAPTGAIDAATATDTAVFAVTVERSRATGRWRWPDPGCPVTVDRRLDVGGDPVLGGRAGAGGREAVETAGDRDRTRDHERVDGLVGDGIEGERAARGDRRARDRRLDLGPRRRRRVSSRSGRGRSRRRWISPTPAKPTPTPTAAVRIRARMPAVPVAPVDAGGAGDRAVADGRVGLGQDRVVARRPRRRCRPRGRRCPRRSTPRPRSRRSARTRWRTTAPTVVVTAAPWPRTSVAISLYAGP